MNSKLFIGFDKRRLDTTYSYLVKENIFHHLTRKKIPFTTDPHEEFSDAVFASAEELSFFYPTILKKNARISIFALSCKDDYLIDPRNPNKITLTQNAYNYYLRADKILVSLDSQAQFLARQGITKNVVITNGSVQLEILEALLPDIDAMNIDLKGFTAAHTISFSIFL